ncbi:ATP-binding protein OS=Streptomyces gougerotii OX=53448 GN=GCM10010227_35800 PE=4 SV=1 [Streptomyces diastaticus subsp. diastaticus]
MDPVPGAPALSGCPRYPRRVIIWLNGSYGAGKTTTARELAALLPDARVFDSETVGALLRPVLAGVPVGNFQDWPPWRGVVVATATQVLWYTGGTLLVPQTVLSEEYWVELSAGFAEQGVPVRHVLLHCDPDTLTRRIRTDTAPESATAGPWRLRHREPYREALPWLRRAAEVVDTTDLTPAQTAAVIAAGREA